MRERKALNPQRRLLVASKTMSTIWLCQVVFSYQKLCYYLHHTGLLYSHSTEKTYWGVRNLKLHFGFENKSFMSNALTIN